jgi:hypothetical protein
MDKRFQVFVSSTFTDLLAERQAVLSGLLVYIHMPAGMELFPAGDDSAWRLIQDVIDSSDYYVLIIGGRYGSLDDTGLGYTEKEYDYAVASKRPVIPFLHANPDNLPRERTDTDTAAWEKLKAFRAKVEKRHTCVYWQTAEELKAKVIVGMTSAIRRSPAVGWIRADKVPTEATLSDILALRTRVSELEAELLADNTRPPKGTEDLVQGDDSHEIDVAFISRDPDDDYRHANDKSFTATIEPTWNEIFAAVAPVMINEATDRQVRNELASFFGATTRATYREDDDLKGRQLVNISLRDDDVLDTCLIQFRALGLIRENQKPRSVKDTQTYWTLTPYGDSVMTQLRAIRRS